MSVIEEKRKKLGDHNSIGTGARFFDDNSKNQRLNRYNNQNKKVNKHEITTNNSINISTCMSSL